MGAADRARARLVDELRDAGRLPCAAVEEAFRAVPRHLFLPEVPLARAYADEAVAVQAVDGVTTSSASQPSMMAIMLEQLDLRPGHRVLEIGAGTGYNAALMARIVGPDGAVVAVDIDADLVDGAAHHLAEAGVDGVELICGDGALGCPTGAPYDRIVLTVGSGDVRPEWVAQLAPGGRLLLPLAVRGTQLSVALDLGVDGVLRSDSVARCAFVRLRGVGATSEPGVQAGDGLSVLPVDDRTAVAELARPALSAPGGARPAPVPLGGGDLWDGFGLWLALTEPEACRLLAGPDDPDAPEHRGVDGERMFRVGTSRVALGLLAVSPHGPGLAAVLLDRDPDSAGPWPVEVQAFGPAGDAAADRVLAALTSWRDAGGPTAADLLLTVVPRHAAIEKAVAATPPVALVEKEYCRVLVRVASP